MVRHHKQQNQATVVGPDNSNQPMTQKKTYCSPGFPCFVMTIMIIFLVLFIFDLLFTVSVDTIDTYFPDPHLMKFIRAFYVIATIITSLFLFVYFKKKLWIKWENEPKYICAMLAILFFILFIIAIIVSGAYRASKNATESFGKVLGGIVLFTITGPLYCCIHICSCKCCGAGSGNGGDCDCCDGDCDCDCDC